MILCCGEALIDMIPTPTTAGPDGFVPHSGGAVFNTAIALGRLGVQVGMLTGLSADMFGRQLVEALEASHVNTSHVVVSDRPTTLAFVRLVMATQPIASLMKTPPGACWIQPNSRCFAPRSRRCSSAESALPVNHQPRPMPRY